MNRTIACIALALFTYSDVADAGGCIFRRSCRGVVVNKVAAVNQVAVANKVVDVQFTPTFVSFVPSQVLLNGQVTTYGQSQRFGYSYQGGYQTQQQAAQAAQPHSSQGMSLEQRMERIEALLLRLAGEDATVQTSAALPIHTFLQTNCVSCHKPGGNGADHLVMFDESGVLHKKLPRYAIYKSIREGSMPKGSAKIEDPATLEALRVWVHEGLSDLEY